MCNQFHNVNGKGLNILVFWALKNIFPVTQAQEQAG